MSSEVCCLGLSAELEVLAGPLALERRVSQRQEWPCVGVPSLAHWLSHTQCQRPKWDATSSHSEACRCLPRTPCPSQLSVPCTCHSVPTPGFTPWLLLPMSHVYLPHPHHQVPWFSGTLDSNSGCLSAGVGVFYSFGRGDSPLLVIHGALLSQACTAPLRKWVDLDPVTWFPGHW